MAILDRLQRMKYNSPEVQALAITAVFYELLVKYKLRSADVLAIIGNINTRVGSLTPELRAVRMYVEREM